MTDEEPKTWRAGYQAGHAKGKRERKAGKHTPNAELLRALGDALTGVSPHHPSWEVYHRHEAAQAVKKKERRPRKICKGSMVRWDIGEGLYAGGHLVKFLRYTEDGEDWMVKMLDGETIERCITRDIITEFGPHKVPGCWGGGNRKGNV